MSLHEMSLHEESCFGLGFPSLSHLNDDNMKGPSSSSSNVNISTNSAAPPPNNNNKHNNVMNQMDTLMQSYMQQCLSYHEQQTKEKVESENRNHQNHVAMPKIESNTDIITIDSPSPVPVPVPTVFIPASVQSSKLKPTIEINVKEPKEELSFEQRIQNAKLIAQRLASKPIQERHHPKQTTNPTTSITNHHNNDDDTTYYPYAQKRKEYLSTIHSNKMQTFLVKNLDYILQKDEEMHSLQLKELQYQQEQLMKQKMIFKQRQQKTRFGGGGCNNNKIKSNTRKDGIGTKERTKLQSSIENQHYNKAMLKTSSTQRKRKKKENNNNNKTCAIYITGIKTQNNERRTKQQEKMILDLLQSYYGCKITYTNYYLDKRTGKRKGDALFVYDLNDVLVKLKMNQGGGDDERGGGNGIGREVDGKDEDDDEKIEEFLKMICDQVRERIQQKSFYFTQRLFLGF